MYAGPLFVAAAKAGEVESMDWAAQYYRAVGDRGEAIRWFTASANAGVRDSMYNLGIRFVEEDDLFQALEWFEKASDAGDSDATLHVENIRQELRQRRLAGS